MNRNFEAEGLDPAAQQAGTSSSSAGVDARRTMDEVVSIAEEARQRFRSLEESIDDSSLGSRASIDQEIADLGAEQDRLRFDERAYRRAREIVQDAYESATEIRLDALRQVEAQFEKANRQAAEIIERTRVEGEALRAEATLGAKLTLQRAERTAEATMADAREQSARLLAAATEEATRIREEARREAAEIQGEAETSLADARQRSSETARLEAEFDRAAREFVKWLGLEARPEQRLFDRVLHRPR